MPKTIVNIYSGDLLVLSVIATIPASHANTSFAQTWAWARLAAASDKVGGIPAAWDVLNVIEKETHWKISRLPVERIYL